MAMVIHKDLKDLDSHADIAVTYTDIAARDADSAFNTATTNINKNVRVNSPLSIFKLMSVGPTVFLELSQAAGVEALGVLTNNFLVKGNDTNVIERSSTNGIAGIFTNDNSNEIIIRPPDGPKTARFLLQSDSGTDIVELKTDTTGANLGIMVLTGDFSMTGSTKIDITAATDLTFTGNKVALVSSSPIELDLNAADTTPVAALRSLAGNSGTTNIHVGDRSPLNNVNANPGDLYVSQNGLSSGVFLHKGTVANTTDWKKLEIELQREAFAVDTTTAALGLDFGIYASTGPVTAVRTLTISTVTIALGTTLFPHRFIVKDESSNAANFPLNIITESGLIDSNTMTSIETDDGAIAFYADGTNVFIESFFTSPRDAVVFTGNSFDVNAQAVDPQSMFFSDDGKKVFVLDRATDTIFEYTLSIAYDVGSTVTFSGNSFSVTTEETSPVTISFNTDGTRMFMAGQANDTFFQYSLSIGFDLGSTVALIAGNHNVGTEDNNPTSIEWKADGTKFFMVGRQTNSVYEYTVSVAYDLSSTVTFTGNSFSVAAQDTAPESVRFSPDGKRFFISATIANVVNEYSLTTPFSLASGVTFTGNSFDYTNEGTVAISVAFKPSGTSMYLLFAAGAGADKFFEYDVFPNFSME